MAATTLDTQTALIVIDLQKGIVGLPTAHPAAEIVHRAGELAAAFRRHGLTVVLVNVAGRPPGRTEQSFKARELPADWTDLVPELNQQPEDRLVTKHTPGAFTGTGLEQYLKGLGVTQVVIAGVSTSMGVESTARHAYELGFHVTFAVDAMTDMNIDVHNNSISRLFPRFGETAATQEIIDLLNKTRSRD